MKICCFRENELETCADCTDYMDCLTIRDFYDKKGYKYKKYRQSLEFIRDNGYAEFIKAAKDWTGPCGRLR